MPSNSEPERPTDNQVQRVLEQRDRQEDFSRSGESAWIVLYESWRTEDSNGGRFCALSPPSHRPVLLSRDSWDLSIGDGYPGFVERHTDHGQDIEYLRYGTEYGIEPLVLIRTHSGMAEEALPQLSEEFRHYHGLWSSPDGSKFLKIHDDGSEEVVAEIDHHLVKVRANFLKQFQAGRQLDLVLYIDSVQFVSDPHGYAELGNLQPAVHDPNLVVGIHVSDLVGGRGRPFSRLLGKNVLAPPSIENAAIWPFERREQGYPDYQIGEDFDGQPTFHTCDPERLTDHYGKNDGEPHYLTPVFFRRSVLQKYYELPEKYSVEDGYVRCGGLWGIRIDNDDLDHVCVFLGDLGRDLPESERFHWKSFNVAPAGGMSATAFKRAFLSEMTDPQAPDLRFKSCYRRFRTNWREQAGWPLYRDLEPADEQILERLRVPLNAGQVEFENQVIGLVKLLIEALDEDAIKIQLGEKAEEKGSRQRKSIDSLSRWMDRIGYPHRVHDVDYLRRLQRLRSKSVAHLKGSDYEALLDSEGVDRDRAREVARMLENAERILRSLAEHCGVELVFR